MARLVASPSASSWAEWLISTYRKYILTKLGVNSFSDHALFWILLDAHDAIEVDRIGVRSISRRDPVGAAFWYDGEVDAHHGPSRSRVREDQDLSHSSGVRILDAQEPRT